MDIFGREGPVLPDFEEEQSILKVPEKPTMLPPEQLTLGFVDNYMLVKSQQCLDRYLNGMTDKVDCHACDDVNGEAINLPSLNFD